MSVIVFAILSLFAKDLIELLTTKSFYTGAEVVIYLVPAVLLSQMYIFAPGMGIKSKTNYILGITLFGVFLNTCLNYFLITHWGIKGAAIATLLSAAATFILHMSISQRLYPAPHKWFHILPTSAAAIMIVVVSYSYSAIHHLSFLERFMVNVGTISVLCLFLLLVGLVKFNEITNVLSTFKNIANRKVDNG
jgi:O-antigen/teichoic acid export membrane protein